MGYNLPMRSFFLSLFSGPQRLFVQPVLAVPAVATLVTPAWVRGQAQPRQLVGRTPVHAVTIAQEQSRRRETHDDYPLPPELAPFQ